MSDVEQRQNPRFDVDATVVVTRSEQHYEGKMLNLSLGGARVVAAMEPAAAVGDRLDVKFTIPTLEDPIEVQVQVRWRAEHDASTFGVQFMTGLRAKQTWAVGRYLEELAQEAGG